MAHITAPTTEAFVSYTATGGQTDFTIPWSFRGTDDIRVWVNSVEQVSGFTVSGTAADGGYTGGTLTFSSGRTLNDVVRLARDTPKARTTDFPYPSSTLNIETLNSALDEAHMIIQEMERDRLRTLRVADGEPEIAALPSAATRADSVLIFDENGDLSVQAISSFTGDTEVLDATLPIAQSDVTGLVAALAGKAASSHTHAAAEISDATAAGQAVLTAANAAAQRTALGLGTAAVAASGDFAAASHTQAPSTLTQAGATSGQVLAWSGSEWAPAAASSGMTKISTTSFTATSTFDVALSGSYAYYVLFVTGMRVGTSAALLHARLSQDNGSTYLSGASEYYGWVEGAAATASSLQLTGAAGLSFSSNDVFVKIMIAPGSAGRNGFLRTELIGLDGASVMAFIQNACRLATTTARATNIRLFPSAGNFVAQGSGILYGVSA